MGNGDGVKLPPPQSGNSSIGSSLSHQGTPKKTSNSAAPVTTQNMLDTVANRGDPHANVSSALLPQNSPASDSHEKTTRNIFIRLWDSLFGNKDNKPKSEGSKINWKFWTWSIFSSQKAKTEAKPTELSTADKKKIAKDTISYLDPAKKHTIIKACINFLNENPQRYQNEKGIFRTAGSDQQSVPLLESAAGLKTSKSPETFSLPPNSDVADVANLMKCATLGLFKLNDLFDEDEDLFADPGQKKYKDSEFYNDISAITSDQSKQPKEKATKIKEKIELLPKEKQELLKDLFVFLNIVQTHSTTNSMNANNLAITFAQNLFPTNISMSDPKAAEKAGIPISVVTFLIENAGKIFPNAQEVPAPESTTASSSSFDDDLINLLSTPDATEITAAQAIASSLFDEEPLKNSSVEKAAVAPDQSSEEDASDWASTTQSPVDTTVLSKDFEGGLFLEEEPSVNAASSSSNAAPVSPKESESEPDKVVKSPSKSDLRIHLPNDGDVKLHLPKTPPPPPPPKK